MKVMVTGATGFVGGRLVRQLLDRGDQVTALVRSPDRARHFAERGARLVSGDLADVAAIADAVQGQELIIHAAALTGAPTEAELLAANRDGTARMIDAAVAAGVPRFLHVSSAAAGGPARRDHPRRGDDDEIDAPVTMYGRSKLAAEAEVRAAPLRWTILRPPTVYGPGDTVNFVDVFRTAKRLGIAPVFGDGSQQISLVHVADLADATLLAAAHPGTARQTFYVNHPQLLSSRQLVETIGATVGRTPRVVPLPHWVTRNALRLTGTWAALTGRKTILHADKVHEFIQPAWTGDPSRFIAATGWQPAFDAATGLADTARWYREQGLL